MKLTPNFLAIAGAIFLAAGAIALCWSFSTFGSPGQHIALFGGLLEVVFGLFCLQAAHTQSQCEKTRAMLSKVLETRSQLPPEDGGFTLLEVSIVLVIIGFIVGGIIIGQSLIRQSQVSSVITDFQVYTAAIKNFQQKYSEMPGDMADAQTFWGSSASCNTTTAPTGTLTCNGNGDDQIGNINNSSGTALTETLWAWQHLANAGMIAGKYNGTSDVIGAWQGFHSIPGVNVPASQVPGGGILSSMKELFPPTAVAASALGMLLTTAT